MKYKKMENKFKRFLAMLLAVVMVIGMMPMNAFAAETERYTVMYLDTATYGAVESVYVSGKTSVTAVVPTITYGGGTATLIEGTLYAVTIPADTLSAAYQVSVTVNGISTTLDPAAENMLYTLTGIDSMVSNGNTYYRHTGEWSVYTPAEEDTVIDTEAELIAALNAGGEAKLSADITISTAAEDMQQVMVDRILDLNGYTLTLQKPLYFAYFGCEDNRYGDYPYGHYGSLTIQDSSHGDGKLAVDNPNGAIKVRQAYLDVTIQNGTFTANNGTLLVNDYVGLGAFTIKGGTFDVPNVYTTGNGTGSIAITGGTFNAAVEENIKWNIPEGYELVNNGDGTLTVQKKAAEPEIPNDTEENLFYLWISEDYRTKQNYEPPYKVHFYNENNEPITDEYVAMTQIGESDIWFTPLVDGAAYVQYTDEAYNGGYVELPADNNMYCVTWNMGQNYFWTTYDPEAEYKDIHPNAYKQDTFYLWVSPYYAYLNTSAAGPYTVEFYAKNETVSANMTCVDEAANIWSVQVPESTTGMSFYGADGSYFSGCSTEYAADGQNMYCHSYYSLNGWSTYDSAVEYKDIPSYAYKPDVFYLWYSPEFLAQCGEMAEPYQVKLVSYLNAESFATMTCVNETANIWSVAIPEGTVEIHMPYLVDGQLAYANFGNSSEELHNMYSFTCLESLYGWSTYDANGTYEDEAPNTGGEDPGPGPGTDIPVAPGGTCVYFDNTNTKLAKPHAYFYDPDNNLMGPGTAMTPVEGEENLWRVEVPAGALNIIFGDENSGRYSGGFYEENKVYTVVCSCLTPVEVGTEDELKAAIADATFVHCDLHGIPAYSVYLTKDITLTDTMVIDKRIVIKSGAWTDETKGEYASKTITGNFADKPAVQVTGSNVQLWVSVKNEYGVAVEVNGEYACLYAYYVTLEGKQPLVLKGVATLLYHTSVAAAADQYGITQEVPNGIVQIGGGCFSGKGAVRATSAAANSQVVIGLMTLSDGTLVGAEFNTTEAVIRPEAEGVQVMLTKIAAVNSGKVLATGADVCDLAMFVVHNESTVLLSKLAEEGYTLGESYYGSPLFNYVVKDSSGGGEEPAPEECEHNTWVDGVCYACGKVCEHKDNGWHPETYTCMTCGSECTHDWGEQHCTICQKPCEECVNGKHGADGFCTVCTNNVGHDFKEDNTIPQCYTCGAENPGFVAAKVGEETYSNLQAAIDAASDGGTVTLLNNIELYSSLNSENSGLFNIAEDANVTIDLNGKTILIRQTNGDFGHFTLFYNYGNLTIADSGTGGYAGIYDEYAYGYDNVIVNHGGNLTINGGSLKVEIGRQSPYVFRGACVNNNASGYGDATLTINGGNVLGSIVMKMGENANNVNITGGYVACGESVIASDGDTTDTMLGAVNISGGEIYGGYGIFVSDNTTVTISGNPIVTAQLPDKNLILKGGTFSAEKFRVEEMAKFVAEGYVIDTSDGWPKVVKAEPEIPNDTEEELAAALAAGGEVTLGGDIELTAPLTITGTVVLDLNGKTLTYNSTTQNEAMITNKGNLTIKDTVGTGVINYNYTGAADSSYGKGNYTISNAGTLTVDGGKITIANLRGHAKYPINNNSTSADAVLVINGGHLYNYNTSAIRQFCNSTTYRNSVTINGGLIEGYSAIWMQNPGKNIVNGQLTITGGEIRTTAAAYVNGTSALKDVSSKIYCTIDGEGGGWDEDSFVTITGGTFNENVYLATNAPAATVGEGATMNGRLELPEPPAVEVDPDVEIEGATDDEKDEIIEDIQNNTAVNDHDPVADNDEVDELDITFKGATVDNKVPSRLTYDVSPKKDGQKVSELTEEITFRLPVPASVSKTIAKVFHNNSFFGFFGIKTSADGKYVEISSKYFSEYSVEFVDEKPVAMIGEQGYATLAAAVAAAQAGDVVTVIDDISGEAVTVTESITITGDKTLNNVSITGSGTDVALTVSNLTFTGNSWINSGNAKKLTVSGVTATEVAPVNGSATNSRSGFIALGASEQNKLELVIENCNIVVSNGGDPVIGWAAITAATISGNTFGSAEKYQNNSDSVKIMSIAEGAVINVIGNTVYSNYNGFVFAQNTTRDNAYTVIVDDNTFYGSADHIWIETSGVTYTNATVQATSDNTVNGNAFTAADIKTSEITWSSYAGVDVVTDANGKVIGGTLASFSNTAVLADGYELDENGKVIASAPAVTTIDLSEGSYTITEPGEYVVSAYEGSNTLTIQADAIVELQGVNITAAEGASAISIESGNVTLNVTADSTVTGGKGGAGVYVAETASVTIKGGKLTAIGNGGADTSDSGAAGIGGTYANGNSGAITIDGATVVAKGYGVHGSGIGSGSGEVVGEIKIINGANVTAYGGYYADGAGTKLQSKYGKSDPEGGAAIGGGGKTASTIANITITDSTVTAYGGSKAAGIGANFWSNVSSITISGNSNVTAQGGSSSAGIGTSRAGDTGVSANITISGGTVTATGGAYGAGIGAGYNADSLGNGADASALPETSITITGGTVTATGGEGGAAIGGGYKSDNVDIDITGGTISATAGALVSGKTVENGGAPAAIGTGANGSGSFENSPAAEIGETATVTVTAYEDGKPAVEGMTNENVEAMTNVTVIETPNPNKIHVKTKAELDEAVANATAGQTIILDADIDYGTSQLEISKAITLDLGGHILTTRNAYGGMSLKNNPTIKNGTIVHASNTAAIKAWNVAAFEDLVIDVQGKGDANKTIGGIVIQSGSAVCVGSIKNVTIKGEALTNGIETYNCGDATENVIGSMENVTIDAKGTGMLISAPCGTATNCSISGGTNGIEIWIKGTYSASLTLVDSDVTGGVFAHDEFSSDPSIVNNGTLNLTVDEATTGVDENDVTLTIARAENGVQGILKEVMDNAEAKVNDTYYATLSKAMAAAQDGDTITLLKNVEITKTLDVSFNSDFDKISITFNGNGHTIKAVGDAWNDGMWLADIAWNVTLNDVTFDGNNTGCKGVQFYTSQSTLNNVTIKNISADKWGFTDYAIHGNASELTVTGTLTFEGCKHGHMILGMGSNTGKTATIATVAENAVLNNVTIILDDVSATLTASAGLTIPTTLEGYEVVYENGVYRVVEKTDDIHITINTDNMTLGNSLAINFWVYKNQMRDGVEYTAKLTRTYADGTTETELVPMSQWVEYNDYYQVVYAKFAAKEMTDTVSIEILMPDGTSASNVFTDSIQEYAMFMLGWSNDAKLKTALVDMLNYGTAAQKEFDHNTDNLANAKLTDAQKALATQSINPQDHWSSSGKAYASNLELKDNIILRLWFKDVTEDMYAEVEFTNHYGKKIKTTVTFDEFMLHNATNNIYSVPVDELVIADGSSEVTCTLYNADGTVAGTITESVESYIAFMIAHNRDSNGLYEATMKFVTSAYNMFH